MKFFPYPITSAELGEFSSPGRRPFVTSHEGEPCHGASNGFIAVRDLLAIEASAFPVRKPFHTPDKLLEARVAKLPWHLFDRFKADHTHHDDGANRKRESWVLLDDHSGAFPKYRHEPMFREDGRPHVFGWFEVGRGRVAIPPQALNLARKLPACRIFTPRLDGDHSPLVPFRYNGGLGFLGGLNATQRAAFPRLGGICCSTGQNPMSGGGALFQ